jgi:hypothetical protein
LLHDAQEHPLLATAHRGDQHLTIGLPHLLHCHERAGDRSAGGAAGRCRPGREGGGIPGTTQARRTASRDEASS